MAVPAPTPTPTSTPSSSSASLTPSQAVAKYLANKRQEALQLFKIVNAILMLMVIYTSNLHRTKYVRVVGECESNWILASSSSSSSSSSTSSSANPSDHQVICCDPDAESQQPPCYSGMDALRILSTTEGAWVIPLIVLVINYVIMMLGPKASIAKVRVIVRRALLYLAIMLFRTFGLYVGLNRVEHAVMTMLLGKPSTTEATSCWYSSLRANGKCASAFDFSDHVVLLVSHFVAISLFEWNALSIEPWHSTAKKTVLRCWMVLLNFFVLRKVYFTCAYFHAPLENVVALLVSQLFVMVPVFLLTQDMLGKFHRWLRLDNFVLLNDKPINQPSILKGM